MHCVSNRIPEPVSLGAEGERDLWLDGGRAAAGWEALPTVGTAFKDEAEALCSMGVGGEGQGTEQGHSSS